MKLGGIRIASPCSAAWDDMTPAGGSSRTCSACQQRVYNLSAMTAREARALIAETGGDLCVRFYARRDGTLLLRDDCAVGLAQLRRDRRERAHAYALTALIAAGVLATGVVAHRAAPPHEMTDAEIEAYVHAHPQTGKYDGPK